jgi:RHS repeat-associated protein
VVADYSYLGLDRPVVVDYPEPDVKLNLASGSGNYPYAGLDQFDRLLQALWQYYGSPSADREKVVYGYDLAGNRVLRDNQMGGSGGQDEKYAYDGLWQVSTLDRGTWDGSTINPKVFGQAWTFDQTGNWANFKQDDNGDGTWDLNQNRTHNLANEIATIQVWGAVVHDALGNMTRIPKPSAPANRYACIWDAWNRLVEVKETDGSGNPTTTVAVYAYDGFYRRTKKVIGASTRDYYYSLGWQVLEERVGGTLDRQFVWGIRHIDDLVLRDRGAERLYAVHDAMHVTAVTNASGAVQERYGYEGFGKPRFMDASFGARSASSLDWETLFDGYRFDAETGLYQVRFRYLHPGLGRWMRRDPLAELKARSKARATGVGFRRDSVGNLYLFCRSRPQRILDSSGLSAEDVSKIVEAFMQGMMEMCDEGLRLDTGWLNNVLSTLGLGYLGCGEQAHFILSRMLKDKLDDIWDFKATGTHDEPVGWACYPPHQWAEASSMNPDDPDIIIDPHRGYLMLLYDDRTEYFHFQRSPGVGRWVVEPRYLPKLPPFLGQP